METEKMLEYTGESKKHLAQLSFKKRCDHDEMCMQEAATTVLSQLDLIHFCILIHSIQLQTCLIIDQHEKIKNVNI